MLTWLFCMSDFMRRCTKCNQEFPETLEYFKKDKRYKNGLTSWCRNCLKDYNTLHKRNGRNKNEESKEKARKYAREYRRKNKDLYRSSRMKSAFGITLEDYNKMFGEQRGLCAICGLPESHKNMYGLKGLSIDHNHNTGKVRGLLCNNCNLAVGQLRVDKFGILNLEMAIKYLKLHK